MATSDVTSYTLSQTDRTGDLTLSSDGSASGTLTISWTGAPALNWRQMAMRKDEIEVKRAIKDWVKGRIPSTMEAEVDTLTNLTNYEKPLVVTLKVHGMLATVSAKRLILPGQFYESSSKSLFSQPTREFPVYFEYGESLLDGVRVRFPAETKLESSPTEGRYTLQKLAIYHSRSSVQTNSILMHRQYDLGTFYIAAKDYADVHEFYDKLATADQQPIVLLRSDDAITPSTTK